MYWLFDRERPHLRNLEGMDCRPCLLRLSATRDRPDTPFTPGDAGDLFRFDTRHLPTRTPTGEEPWGIEEFRILDNGHAAFNVRYQAKDLLRGANPKCSDASGRELDTSGVARATSRLNARAIASAAKAAASPELDDSGVRDSEIIQRRDGEVWIALPARREIRVRLQSERAVGLFRLFGRIRGIQGSAIITLGAGHDALVATTLEGITEPRWLQADQPRDSATWLEIRNAGTSPTRIVVSDWIQVPRVRPIHRIHPPRLTELSDTRLMDGVVYGRALRLDAPGHKIARTKSAIVLPAGPVAIRLRAGLPYDAPADANARLTVTLVNADGTRRSTIVRDETIQRLGPAALFLAITKVPTSDIDRVEFLQFEWTGATDIRVVDLTVIRP